MAAELAVRFAATNRRTGSSSGGDVRFVWLVLGCADSFAKIAAGATAVDDGIVVSDSDLLLDLN